MCYIYIEKEATNAASFLYFCHMVEKGTIQFDTIPLFLTFRPADTFIKIKMYLHNTFIKEGLAA